MTRKRIHGLWVNIVRGIGFPCVKCGESTHVVNTIWSVDRHATLRQRKCSDKKCGARSWTEEKQIQ